MNYRHTLFILNAMGCSSLHLHSHTHEELYERLNRTPTKETQSSQIMPIEVFPYVFLFE